MFPIWYQFGPNLVDYKYLQLNYKNRFRKCNERLKNEHQWTAINGRLHTLSLTNNKHFSNSYSPLYLSTGVSNQYKFSIMFGNSDLRTSNNILQNKSSSHIQNTIYFLLLRKIKISQNLWQTYILLLGCSFLRWIYVQNKFLDMWDMPM